MSNSTKNSSIGWIRENSHKLAQKKTIMLQPTRPCPSEACLLGLRTGLGNRPPISLQPFTKKNRHFLTRPLRPLHLPPPHPKHAVTPTPSLLGRPAPVGYVHRRWRACWSNPRHRGRLGRWRSSWGPSRRRPSSASLLGWASSLLL
jgi:hypothetical protein